MTRRRKTSKLYEQLRRSVVIPLGRVLDGKAGSLPEQTDLIMSAYRSAYNLALFLETTEKNSDAKPVLRI